MRKFVVTILIPEETSEESMEELKFALAAQVEDIEGGYIDKITLDGREIQ